MASDKAVEAGARAMEPSAFETFDRGYTQANFIDHRRFLNAEKVVRSARRKARAALIAAEQVDDGWVRVPREPTKEMVLAGETALENAIDSWRDSTADGRGEGFSEVRSGSQTEIYRAMIAAAPSDREGD